MSHISYRRTRFVDRESWLEEMVTIIGHCGEGHFLRNIHGIGGIGKTALLRQWDCLFDYAIYVDCTENDHLITRIGMIGQSIQRIGVDTPRFRLLWSVRTRVLEGLEPSSDVSGDWIFDFVRLIPNDLLIVTATIAKRLKSTWQGLKEAYAIRWGDVGEWFKEQLGTEWGEAIISLVWKEPKMTITYLLKALAADINARQDPTYNPILFLFDRVEMMNPTDRELLVLDRPAPEIVLWHSFVSGLKGVVAVTSGRVRIEGAWCSDLSIDQKELQELDEQAVVELIQSRNIDVTAWRAAILRVGHGHPFLIQLICDGIEQSILGLEDLTTIQSRDLEEVRLDVWRVIFSRAQQVYSIVEYASLFSSFDRELLTMMFPQITSDTWQSFIDMSFTRQRDGSKWELHTLARKLAKIEMGSRHDVVVESVLGVLDDAFKRNNDSYFLAKKLTVMALLDEQEAIHHVLAFCQVEHNDRDYSRSLKFLNELEMPSEKSQAVVHTMKGQALLGLHRIGEAIDLLSSSIDILEEQLNELDSFQALSLVSSLNDLGVANALIGNTSTAKECLERAIAILQEHERIDDRERRIALEYVNLGATYEKMWRIHEAREILEESLKYFLPIKNELDSHGLEGLSHVYRNLGVVYTKLGMNDLAEEAYDDAKLILEELEKNYRGSYDDEISAILLNRANMLELAGKRKEAEDLYFEALVRIEGKEFPISEANVLRNLGILYHNAQRLDDAEHVLTKAKGILENLPDGTMTSDYFSVILSLGNVWIKRNEIDLAASFIEPGISGLQSLIDNGADALLPEFAGRLINMGVLYYGKGILDKAEDYLRRSLEIHHQLVEREPGVFCREVAMVNYNLGLVLEERKDYLNAEEKNLVSLSIYSGITRVSGIDVSEDIGKVRESLYRLYSLMGIPQEQIEERIHSKSKDIPSNC